MDIGGIPPIPLALVRTLEPYGRYFGPEVIRWPDSGSGLYMKIRAAGIRLLRSAEPGAIPRLWQELGTSDTYDVYLSPDSRYAVFNSDKNGDEHLRNLLCLMTAQNESEDSRHGFTGG